MSFGLRLELRQSQGLVLTPQLQQAIKLLQLSNTDLISYVDQQLNENPLLDRREAPPQAGPAIVAGPEVSPLGGNPVLPTNGSANGVDDGWHQPGAPVASDSTMRIRRNGADPGQDGLASLEERLTKPMGLRQHLQDQMTVDLVEPERLRIAQHLIELVDDDGYLREPLDQVAQALHTSIDAVEAALRAVQGLDPTGVGARDLRECLMLQLRELDRLDPAMQALLDHLPLLARGDSATLKRVCGIDAEDLQDMIREIRRLNPKPGLTYSSEPTITYVPDVYVLAIGPEVWRIELNTAALPRVLVDSSYYSELCTRSKDKGEREYLSERLQSANWLVKALDQRARTLLKVTKAIFARQRGFLTGGATQLRPLVLRDIAEATGLHESTVSRATSEKYVATPRGTFPLKYFFTAALPGTEGQESHSAEAIRQQIRTMVDREDPANIFSDDQIVAQLKRNGVVIARRTIAKYREALGIASSVERRRSKALREP